MAAGVIIPAPVREGRGVSVVTLKNRQAQFTSGGTAERARLEGVIPFQVRVHLPWERLPGRTPVYGGHSLRTGGVPKTAHNKGTDPKTELEKVKHCFAARLLVGLLCLLSCYLSCAAPCLWVFSSVVICLGVSVLSFPRRRATAVQYAV